MHRWRRGDEGLGLQLLESVRGLLEVLVGSDRGSLTRPGDEESFSTVISRHHPTDEAVFGVELPAVSHRVHGAERPFAKHSKSRHIHPDSMVKSTGRPAKLLGPKHLLGSIPLGHSRPTSLRSGSLFFPSGMVSAFPQIPPVPPSSMVRVQDWPPPLLSSRGRV